MNLSHAPGRRQPMRVVLREWQERVLPGVELSNEGRALARRLAEGGGPVDVDELRHGLRVRTRSWVGVIGLNGLEIRIEPKLSGDQIALVRLLERTLGLDGLKRLHGRVDLDLSGASLLDLVALLFAESCAMLLRRGLRVGYVEKEESVPVVRGRILVDRQLLDRFGRMDRVLCRFDELEHDVDENRLISAALGVAHRRVASASVRRRIARMRAVFESICDAEVLDLRGAREAMSDHFYDRLNSHYRQSHQLAWLLLDGLGVDDLTEAGSTSCFSFLFDMNPMFERLVEQWVRRISPLGSCVASQSKQASILWNVTAHRSYGRVIPDLIVSSKGPHPRAVAIDAKYKLYDERRVDPGDIYQTFLYAYSLSQHADSLRPTSVIVYPSSDHASRLLRIRVQPRASRKPAEILALGVCIPDVLDDLDARTCVSESSLQLRDSVQMLIAQPGSRP